MEKFLTRFAGFSSALLGRCTGTTRGRVAQIGGIVLLVATISSTLLAVSAHYIWGAGPLTLLPIAIVWFAFISQFDRIILQSMRDSWVIGIRILMAVLLALMHGFFVDLLVFHKDVQLALNDERKSLADSISAKYQPPMKELASRMDTLDTRKMSLNNRLVSWRNALAQESDGSSPSHRRGVSKIYRTKYGLFMQDSLQAVEEIKGLNERVALLNHRQDSLTKAMRTEVNSLPNLQVESGVAKKLSTAYKIIFLNGNWLMIAFYLIAGVLMVCFEMLPVLCKYGMDLSEILKIQQQEIDDNVSLCNEQSKVDTEIKLSVMKLHQANQIDEPMRSYMLRKFNSELEDVRFKFDKKKTELEYYDKAYAELMASASVYKEEFETMVKNSVKEISGI